MWFLDGLRFIRNSAIPPAEGFPLNLGFIESSVGLDRLATEDEVRGAMSSPGAVGLVGLGDEFSEMDPDSSSRACNLRGDVEWLMIVLEMRDSISN